MRLVAAAVWTMIGLTVATPVPIGEDLPPAVASNLAKRNPSASKLKFIIDGTAGYFVGVNAPDLFYNNEQQINTTLDHMKTTGIQVVRIWGNTHSTSNEFN